MGQLAHETMGLGISALVFGPAVTDARQPVWPDQTRIVFVHNSFGDEGEAVAVIPSLAASWRAIPLEPPTMRPAHSALINGALAPFNTASSHRDAFIADETVVWVCECSRRVFKHLSYCSMCGRQRPEPEQRPPSHEPLAEHDPA